MSGRMTCWIIYEYKNSDTIEGLPVGVTTTVFVDDSMARVRTLMIYGVAKLKDIPIKVWKEKLLQLKDYAKAFNCQYITAEASGTEALALAKALGADCSVRQILLEV